MYKTEEITKMELLEEYQTKEFYQGVTKHHSPTKSIKELISIQK